MKTKYIALLVFLIGFSIQSTNKIVNTFLTISSLRTQLFNNIDKTSESCKNALSGLIHGDPNYSKILDNLIKYTSKNLGELGDYSGCAKAGGKHIFMNLVITPGIPSTTGIGICGPMECQESDYNNAFAAPIRSLLPTICQAMDIPLKGRYWIMDNSIVFYDTKLHAETVSEITPLCIIFFIICGLALLIGIIASCIDSNKTQGKFNTEPNTISEKLIHSFSLVRNLRSLIYPDHAYGKEFNILFSLETIMVLWVTASHVCFYLSSTPMINILDQNWEIQNNAGLQLLVAGELGIDSLICLFGISATICLLRLKNEDFKPTILLKLFIRRYARFLLVYIMVIIFTISAANIYHSESPLSMINEWAAYGCRDRWYENFLMINNFFIANYGCLAWAPYITLDFHYYIIAIIISYIYTKSKKYAVLTMLAILSICVCIQIWAVVHYEFSYTYLYNHEKQYDIFLIRPYVRISSYFFGMIAAWTYYSYTCKGRYEIKSLNKFIDYFMSNFWLRIIIYAIALSASNLMFYVQYIFNHYPESISLNDNIVFLIFSRFIYITGFIVIILAVLLGKLNVLRAFLTSKFWGILGRSAFTAYQLNGIFITTERASEMHGLYLSNPRVIFMTMHISLITYIYSIGFTALFEAPMAWIMNYFIFPEITEKVYPANSIDIPNY